MNFRIVLIEPEIPQNTGNIARLCAAAGLELVLVGKLGFSIDDKHLKRAGMDYWGKVPVSRAASVGAYFNEKREFVAISTKGEKFYSEITDNGGRPFDLVFGCESSGLPPFIYSQYPDKLYRIPMREGLRSLNLSSAAAIVAYSLLLKKDFSGLV